MDDSSRNEEELIAYWNAVSCAEEKLPNIAKCYKVRPQLLGSYQLPRVMVPGEKIVNINFSPDDAYLTVSTNRRILLLSMQPFGSGASSMIDLEDDRSSAVVASMRVYGWTEMDSTGSSQNDVVGHFAFHFYDRQNTKVQNRTEYVEPTSGSLFTQRQKTSPKIVGVLWKIAEYNEPVLQGEDIREMKVSYGPFKNNYLEELELKNCRISRQLWTEELFQCTLRKLRSY
jgi:hypothetical protein